MKQKEFLVLGMLLLALTCNARTLSDRQAFDPKRTLNVGYIVFPGFEPIDVWGPLEILFQVSVTSRCGDGSSKLGSPTTTNGSSYGEHKLSFSSQMSYAYNMTLSVIWKMTGPVSARSPPHRMATDNLWMDVSYMIGPSITATHTFENAPALDVIIVPGGEGNVVLEKANDTVVEDFIARRFYQADYVLSVCTGAVSLAKAGVLSGRRATTNKSAWYWATDKSHGANITWVPTARWVADGKVWTSSGAAAGLDMTYAFLKHLYGTEKLDPVMNLIEYAPHTDPNWDPFSVVWEVPGAYTNHSIRCAPECGVPVGT